LAFHLDERQRHSVDCTGKHIAGGQHFVAFREFYFTHATEISTRDFTNLKIVLSPAHPKRGSDLGAEPLASKASVLGVKFPCRDLADFAI
jgi:hypothetical protein